jgi:hypothetical protein
MKLKKVIVSLSESLKSWLKDGDSAKAEASIEESHEPKNLLMKSYLRDLENIMSQAEAAMSSIQTLSEMNEILQPNEEKELREMQGDTIKESLAEIFNTLAAMDMKTPDLLAVGNVPTGVKKTSEKFTTTSETHGKTTTTLKAKLSKEDELRKVVALINNSTAQPISDEVAQYHSMEVPKTPKTEIKSYETLSASTFNEALKNFN